MTRISRLVWIAVLFLLSCGGPSEITQEIEGIYKFKYPSGQVEVISIKRDYSYNQTIYSNDNDYTSHRNPLHSNYGTWTYNGNRLEFDHWLAYCEMLDPKAILAKPYYTNIFDVTWSAPDGKMEGRINFFLENGYVFTQVNGHD